MMRRTRNTSLALMALLWTGLSCGEATAPPTKGGIRIVIVSEKPASTLVSDGNQDGTASTLVPVDAPTANVLLDSVRMSVTGPETRSVTNTAAVGGSFTLTIADLDPGSYSVTVVGYAGAVVAHYAQTTASVTAGVDTDAPVVFTLFQPPIPGATGVDTVEVLRFTASWTAVTNATGYVVEWSSSPTLATFTSVSVTGTSTDIVVPAEGQYYFAVRAVNTVAPSGGLRSSIKSVVVFQSVANVTVLPATPSIVDGTTQQFNATARDLDNNTMAGLTLFWSSSNHSVATVSQSGLVTAVGPGQATITAIAKGTPGNALVTVTQQAATKLAFTAAPTNAIAGQAIGPIKVSVLNDKNEVRTSDNTTQVTLAIGANPGAGTLAGTATATVVNGVATFNNLNINRSGSGYTLQATATSLTSVTSTQFNITAGVATQLAFTVQPTNSVAGNSISPALQVEVRDALGNRVTSARNAITLAIGTNPASGTLSGTSTASAIDGIASFSGLSLDKAAAGYTLTASTTGLTQGTSGTFTIDPTTVAALAFGTQPVNTSTDGNVTVTVRAIDRFGNLTNTVTPVTVSLATNPAGGTLTGTTTQSTTAGTATFNDLDIDKVGTGYTLRAQSGTLTSATSSAFNMTIGVPAKLSFATPPQTAEPGSALNTIEVSIDDAAGNRTSVAANVTLAIGTNPGNGALSGVLTSASVAGVATFTGLSIDSAAVGYTLNATSAGLTSKLSDPFDLVIEFAQIRSGGLHTCGLTTQGTAYCWGWNAVSSVGDGSATSASRLRPSRVSSNDKYFRISLGDAHACALRTTDSTAFCWGWNTRGQTGIGSTAAVPTPTAVLGGNKFFAISAGYQHTCAIRVADSLAFCWGEQNFGRLGNNQTATAIVSSPVAVNSADKFASISAGVEHSCAVRNDGTGFCWGRQLNGRLGNTLTVEASVGNPTAIGGMTFLEISAGNQASCGIRAPITDQRGYCWGANGNGQLGSASIETGSPTEIAGGLRYSSLKVGGRAADQFGCGLSTTGAAYCWGSQVDGRLGNGTNTGSANSPQAVLLNGTASSISSATAGGPAGPLTSGHGCAITTGGVYCWGNNFASATNGGMLGDGTNSSSSVPVKVKGQR